MSRDLCWEYSTNYLVEFLMEIKMKRCSNKNVPLVEGVPWQYDIASSNHRDRHRFILLIRNNFTKHSTTLSESRTSCCYFFFSPLFMTYIHMYHDSSPQNMTSEEYSFTKKYEKTKRKLNIMFRKENVTLIRTYSLHIMY